MLSKDSAHRKDLSGKPASMTHQHFRQIAEIIREIDPALPMTSREIAGLFATRLAATNPKFDRHRFLMACGHEKAA